MADQPLRWIFRLIPGYSLGNGLNQIASIDILPLLAAVCYPDARSTRVYDALDSDVAGANIVYLALTAPFYLALTIIIDIALTSPRVRGYLEAPPAAVADAPCVDDIDVAAEQARVAAAMADPASGGAGAIQIAGLRKVFRTLEGKPKVAVRGLSLGLDVGDVFGFLGVNGAGARTGGLRRACALLWPEPLASGIASIVVRRQDDDGANADGRARAYGGQSAAGWPGRRDAAGPRAAPRRLLPAGEGGASGGESGGNGALPRVTRRAVRRALRHAYRARAPRALRAPQGHPAGAPRRRGRRGDRRAQPRRL